MFHSLHSNETNQQFTAIRYTVFQMFFLLASAANACGKGGECAKYVEKCCADIVWKHSFQFTLPLGSYTHLHLRMQTTVLQINGQKNRFTPIVKQMPSCETSAQEACSPLKSPRGGQPSIEMWKFGCVRVTDGFPQSYFCFPCFPSQHSFLFLSLSLCDSLKAICTVIQSSH